MEVIVSCGPNSNISSLSNFSYQTTVKFGLSDWKYWLWFSLTTRRPADSNGTILCQHIHTVVDPHIITNAFCIMFLPHLRKIIHYIIHVVHVWYGINIVCIGHFTPPVDLSDRPFKTERPAQLLCTATKGDHIINLSPKHRSIWEAYCLHVFFLLAVSALYAVALNIWSLYVIW